jgi:hypothetical protein
MSDQPQADALPPMPQSDPLRAILDAVRENRAERRDFERHISGELAGIRERVASLEREDQHMAAALRAECPHSKTEDARAVRLKAVEARLLLLTGGWAAVIATLTVLGSALAVLRALGRL